MSARTSRKRNVPARLREELWYLVKYEEDENLRVLAEDEICHIFPDEEEGSEMQVGDIVSALWIPNGQYYDAKILEKGADKNELMRERLRLEKEKKNGSKEKEGQKAQQKRKCPEGEPVGQKNKKKVQKETESAKEKEQKAKDREEKKKKKEQEQERQKLLLETKKVQAASRWAASNNTDDDGVSILANPVNATFTPEPIRQSSSSLPRLSSTPLTYTSSCSSSQSSTPLTPAHSTLSSDRAPNTSTMTTPGTMHSTQGSLAANPTLLAKSHTPARPTAGTKSKGSSEPRRGLHYQSAIADSSDEEIDEQDEVIPEETDVIAELTDVIANSDCCKEQRLETKALRKRLEKVHRRLTIALKAKTTAEVTNNRPGAGILDQALAAEYKMVEVMEGSGVFWYPHQRAYCSAFKCWAGYINAALDIFFTKETLAVSNAKGSDKKSANGGIHRPLPRIIIDALIGKVCSKFAKDSPVASQIVQKINMKCVEARRPQRIRAPRQV